ncbi:MAG: carbonic anhydrase [Pseudolabrys sp.]
MGGPDTLDHLFDRNVEWAQRKTRDDPTFFLRMAEQQTPNFLWIGCSDSRVTANDVLGLDPGEVFVQRNIANVVHTSDMNLLAVLEYAIEILKVEHVIVCGHYGCGGVTRALSDDRSALVDHWLQPIAMLYRKHHEIFDAIPDMDARISRMCEFNIEMQVRRVAAIPTVENAWVRGQKLHLHGWIYGTNDGLLRDLGPTLSSLAERDALMTIDERMRMPAEPISGIRRHALEAFSGREPNACPDCGTPRT